MPLIDVLATQLSESLLRKAANTASRWGERYVILGKPVPGPMRFDLHPWSRAFCDEVGDWVGKKGAQMAMSHSCLVRCLFSIDILRNSVLYVLPKRNPDAVDFSRSKFDTLLESSPYLRTLFSNVRNVGHKQAGSIDFFLRGSRSRSGLKGISVGLKIFDEFDEMVQNNVPLAEERSSGYKEEDSQTIKISTPTFPKFGISKEFLISSADHYFFRCPYCSLEGRPKWSELQSINCIQLGTDNPNDRVGLRRSQILTSCCKRPLPENKQTWINERNCRWFATQQSSDVRGFWIPQMYSLVKPTWKIAKQILEAETDEVRNQELHNSVLAQEYVPKGAKILPEHVDACKGNHVNRTMPKSPIVTMGVDVGHKTLYCWIDEWMLPPDLGANLNSRSIPLTRAVLQVPSFYDLDRLMGEYQVKYVVLDVDPAFRDAIDFCHRFPRSSSLCRFTRGITHRDIVTETGTEIVRQVNRTVWLDQALSRFRNTRIVLPKDLGDDVTEMLGNLIAKSMYDKDGNLVVRYINVGPDHYAFARCYSEIAFPHSIAFAEGCDIRGIL